MPEARAYLGDERLELDNNICERSIRPVAPGRKNCLFMGSVGGGEAAAIAYALIETAEMNNVDPEAWLTWMLERIADHRLTPSTNSCRGTGSPKTSKTRPDRTDTLDAIAVQTDAYGELGDGLVVTCSALKRSYRDWLRQGVPALRVVHLTGNRQLHEERMNTRTGHFMPPSLLDSQLEALEPPQASEKALMIDIDATITEMTERIISGLS